MATARGVDTTLEWLVVPEPVDELNRQRHVNRDREHLEDNATQHDPSTFLRVLMIPGRNRRKGSANTLDT